MNFLSKLQQHRYYKQILILTAIALLYLMRSLYVWVNTQSTDNAYVDGEISLISSNVSGNVTDVFTQENTHVSVGQIIAKIDEREYKWDRDIKFADFQAANLNSKSLEHRISKTQMVFEQKKKELETAEAEFAVKKKSFARTKELSYDKFASKHNFDSASLELEKAENNLLNAKLSVEIAKEDLSILDLDKKTADTQLEKCKAALELAEKKLQDTNIVAPISGVVSNYNLFIKKGSFINISAPLFSIVPLDKIYIRANFKETQLAQIAAKMEASILIDAHKGEVIKGKVRSISPASGSKFSLLPQDNATGNFTKIVQRIPVIIDLDIPDHLKDRIFPGMSATVKIRVDK